MLFLSRETIREMADKTPSDIKPTSTQERYEILDVLRGFALIGIITANMILYSLYLYLPGPQKLSLATPNLDRILDFLELMFVEGKFYTIFSILFGIGFSILLTRAVQKGLVFYRFFLRRVFFLFLIGLAHAILVWNDDILECYAVCGAFLLFFVKRRNRTILAAATIALILPVLIHLAGGIEAKMLIHFRDSLFQKFGFTKETVIHIWTTGSYGDIVKLNLCKWFDQVKFLITSGMVFKIFGNFLLGFYIGRNEIYNKIDRYAPLIRKLAIWGFAFGLPLNYLYARTFDSGSFLSVVIAAIAVLPMSMAYVCLLCLFWLKSKWKSRLAIFAPVGRMALTNYVSQSIICTFIFYGTGLGLGGQIGPAIYFPIGIMVYCTQIVFSRYWLKYFQFGPLEWLWRILTYGQWLSLTKKSIARERSLTGI